MAIETTLSALSTPPLSVFETQAQRPRPQDVGILGIEMYFPQRVGKLASLTFSSSLTSLFSVHFRGRARGL